MRFAISLIAGAGHCCFGIMFTLGLALVPVDSASGSELDICTLATTEPGVVARTGLYGEIVLENGTALRPADIWVSRSEEIIAPGTRVTYRKLTQSNDRWGRWPSRIMVQEMPEPVWLARRLVAQGKALVRPETAEHACIKELGAGEQTARTSRNGLWKDSGLPIDAETLAELTPQYGTFVVAEGLVHSVGVRKYQTYLNFGRRWNESLAVMMSKSLWTQATARSITAATLEGRQVRVRGVLQQQRGPTIRIERLDEIELLGDR